MLVRAFKAYQKKKAADRRPALPGESGFVNARRRKATSVVYEQGGGARARAVVALNRDLVELTDRALYVVWNSRLN